VALDRQEAVDDRRGRACLGSGRLGERDLERLVGSARASHPQANNMATIIAVPCSGKAGRAKGRRQRAAAGQCARCRGRLLSKINFMKRFPPVRV
jgi:hypothetical protein